LIRSDLPESSGFSQRKTMHQGIYAKPSRLLRRKDVENAVGLKRSSIYELMKKGEFPRPIRIGLKAVGWLEHEVEDWLTERVRMSREVKS
jgi:prophage regulatory protein